VTVFVDCLAARAGSYELEATLGGQLVSCTVVLNKGFNRSEVKLTVNDPKLWWPNGYGPQPLYDLTVRLGSDIVSKRIGLRSLQLFTRMPWAFRWSSGSTARISSARGRTGSPMMLFPSEKAGRAWNTCLSSAARAHMNMIRIWGGGKYESDDFAGGATESDLDI
jgi:beta-mannosidase